MKTGILRPRRITGAASFLMIMALITLASAAGGFIAASLGSSPPDLSGYSAELSGDFDKYDVFMEALSKYGLFVVVIWSLGFAKKAAVLSVVPLSVRGISAGYALGAMIRAGAINMWLNHCLLQNIILLPTYVFLTNGCLGMGLDPTAERRKLPEYILVGVLSIGAALLAALSEALSK